jgi:hypothetical protein
MAVAMQNRISSLDERTNEYVAGTSPAGAAAVQSRPNIASIAAWAICAIAVILIYSAIWRTAPFHGTDTADYIDSARDIAAGIDKPEPRTPGFPLFLLLVGTGCAYFVVSMALHLAAVGLLAWVLLSMQVSKRLVALFAAVAVLPPFMQKDAYLLTEGLAEFLMVAGLAGLWLRRGSVVQAAWSGLAFALATITRPQNQLLPILIAILMVMYFGWKLGRKYAVALLAPFVVLVGGLVLHNAVKFGYPSLTYLLGHHLGTKTVSLFDDIPDKQVRDIMVSTRNDAYVHRNPYWTTWYTRETLMKVKDMTPVQLAKYMQKIHMHLILTHPLAYVEEFLRTFARFWLPDAPAQTNHGAILRLVSLGTQLALCIAFWFIFVFWAGLLLGRLVLPIPEWLPEVDVRFLYTTAMLVIFYTAALGSALDIGEPRYRSAVDLVILFVIVVTAHFLGKQRAANA